MAAENDCASLPLPIDGKPYWTTGSLGVRWGRHPGTIRRYVADPEHPLRYDVDRHPGHHTRGKGFSPELVAAVESSWRVSRRQA